MHAKSVVFTVLSAAAIPALAELAVTSPTATTVCRGGERCTVAWNDNASPPTLAQQGLSTIALYTGGRQQQTFLQPIAFPEAVNVATTASASFVVDPSVGENGQFYFIRFTSTEFRNGNNPYLSFSAVFELQGMTGTFNSTVRTQIEGGTAPPSSVRSSASSTPAATSTSRVITSVTRSSSATASASSEAAGSGAFESVRKVGMGLVGLVGAAVGFALL